MRRIVFVILIAFMLASCTTATIASRPQLSDGEKEKLLRERVAENWQAMVESNRGRAYEIFDPFFRTRTTREWFVGLATPVKYHSFEIGDVSVQGNVAIVWVDVKYSIKHIGSLGQKIEELNREKNLKEKWLFIDNNWYRQFFDASTDGTFAHY